MAVLKFVDVSDVQAGDVLAFPSNNRLICDYVETDGVAVDLQLHDSEGNKIRKTICVGEQVSIEI